MWHLGNIAHYGVACDVLAHCERQLALGALELGGSQYLTDSNRILVDVGDFYAHYRLSGNRCFDTHALCGKVKGDIVLKSLDLGDFNTCARLYLVTGYRRATENVADLYLNAETLKCVNDSICLLTHFLCSLGTVGTNVRQRQQVKSGENVYLLGNFPRLIINKFPCCGSVTLCLLLSCLIYEHIQFIVSIGFLLAANVFLHRLGKHRFISHHTLQRRQRLRLRENRCALLAGKRYIEDKSVLIGNSSRLGIHLRKRLDRRRVKEIQCFKITSVGIQFLEIVHHRRSQRHIYTIAVYCVVCGIICLRIIVLLIVLAVEALVERSAKHKAVHAGDTVSDEEKRCHQPAEVLRDCLAACQHSSDEHQQQGDDPCAGSAEYMKQRPCEKVACNAASMKLCALLKKSAEILEKSLCRQFSDCKYLYDCTGKEYEEESPPELPPCICPVLTIAHEDGNVHKYYRHKKR